MWDLAWALHSFVGLWPNSSLTHHQIVSRIAAFCDGAEVGSAARPLLLDVVVERTQDHASMLRNRALSGEAVYRRLVSDCHADRWKQGSDYVAANRGRWSQLLEL